MRHQRVPVMVMDDHAPPMIPAMMGKVNSLMEGTPRMKRQNTEINVVREVLILLDRV